MYNIRIILYDRKYESSKSKITFAIKYMARTCGTNQSFVHAWAKVSGVSIATFQAGALN